MYGIELPDAEPLAPCPCAREANQAAAWDQAAWAATVKASVENPVRLAAIRKTGLLDSPPEEAFDRFTRLAARMALAPIAMVSLMDERRQFFKSALGLPAQILRARGTPLSQSFCQHLVALREPLVIVDTREHRMVRDSPLIQEGAIAYLGVPLALPGGEVLGSLCVIDVEPRDWADEEIASLQELAAMAVTEIRLREDISERKQAEARLIELHRELVSLSRESGMAEIATSVLHNVGNVLNSVNISLEVASTKVRAVRAAGLGRTADLLHEHAHDLPAFLGVHPQGRRLGAYLRELARHIDREQTAALGEITALRKHFDHISEVVVRQQRHAGAVGGMTEILSINEMIEDALRMNAPSPGCKGSRIMLELDAAIPPLPLDRHKIMLILVNLIRNARHALADARPAAPCLTVRTKLAGPGRLSISIADNGIGIRAENFARIFEFGFTTRPSGHGFGLHSCAIAAQEMGGSLGVGSAGPGQGAIFTLEIPIEIYAS